MSVYKYYAVCYATGITREIVRGDAVALKDFGTGGFWRAKKDGSWSSLDADVVPILNLWMKGDFHPEDDEISEERAIAYLDDWRSSGKWPGRD